MTYPTGKNRSLGSTPEAPRMARARFILLAGVLAFSAVKCNAGGLPPSSNKELPGPLRPEPSVPVGTIKASFSVSPDGDAQYTVPIPVPPGRAGLQPAISVVYDSGQEESQIGVGWSIQGFSAIRRCGSTIAQDGYVRQVTFDADDHFCLGDQRLIAVNGQYGAPGTTYHTEKESYARIVSRGLGPDYFEVWTKSGQVHLYGCDPEYPDHGERGKCNALIFARDDIPQAWAIKEVRDRLDNYMVYHYSRWDSLASEDYNFSGPLYYTGPPETVEFAPYLIQYTGKRGDGSQAPQRSITFDYEPGGSGVPTGTYTRRGHFAGIRTRLSRHLVSIRTSGPGLNDAHVFRFSYETSSATRRRILKQIEQCDNQGVCLPPTVFEWKAEKLEPVGVWRAPPTLIPANTRIHNPVALDVNGDGISDLAYVRAEYWRLLISTGEASNPFTSEVDTEIGGGYDHWENGGGGTCPLEYCVWTSIPFPMDYNGDGLDDLVVSTRHSDYLYVLMSTGDNLSLSGAFSLRDNPGNDDKQDYINDYLKFIDIDGDGLNPVIRGWASFYRHCFGAHTVFNRLDWYIWDRIWRWLRKKHPKLGARKLYARYCCRTPTGKRKVWGQDGVLLFLADTLKVERFRLGNMSPPDFTRTSGEPDAYRKAHVRFGGRSRETDGGNAARRP